MALPANPTRRPSARQLSELELAAWTGMLRAHSKVTRLLDQELEAECRMSLGQYEVLLNLARSADRRRRMTDLAEQVLLSRSGLTRLVDRLEAAGLVERQSCPSDARGTFAWLTPAGMDRLREASRTHLRGVREHVTDRLTPEQQQALAEVTARLLAPSEPGC